MSRAERREQTRSRILHRAAELFARHGFDRTSLRAVAAAAQVDPRLVLHYFGSKEGLFGAVLDGAAREDATTPSTGGGPAPDDVPLHDVVPPATRAAVGTAPGSCVAEEFLQQLAVKLRDGHAEAAAMIRSMLTNDAAADQIRGLLAAQEAALGARLVEDDAGTRIALVGAVVLGVVVGRDLLGLPGLARADPDALIDLLRPCVHLLTHGVTDHDGCGR